MDAVTRDCGTCHHEPAQGDCFGRSCLGCRWQDPTTRTNWEPKAGIGHALGAGKGPRQTVPVEAPKVEAVADTGGGAVKADTGKSPMSLLPRSALLAEADVLGFGARKYAAHNWRKGMKFSRLGDAALRHLLAWLDGEDADPETGLSHLAHLRCCVGFLIEYQAKGLGEDDRFKPI